MPAQGPPRLFLIPPMDWQVNQKLWAFRFLFLTEKLSVLPIRLDMLVWGVWSFACTIKIHCACWDLRPRPREAPIPHQRARLLPGSGPGRRVQGLPGPPPSGQMPVQRAGLRLLASCRVRWGPALCHSSAMWLPWELWCEHTWVPRRFLREYLPAGFPRALRKACL